MTASSVPNLKLNSGNEIPQLGFGVFLVEPDDTEEAVTAALEIGYRHLDTAEMYGNEAQVGEAIRRFDIEREQVFVTSKLNNKYLTFDQALRAFERSLSDLGTDYVDMFLIHWPLPTVRDFMDVWRALEQVHRDGRAKAIGVSNFQIAHLERLLAESEVTPAVNQIELHPYLTQEKLKTFGEERGILTEAWSPIGRGKVLDDAVIAEVADRVGKTEAQVVLRWHIQQGNIIFPKSTRPERMKENYEIFDFSLTDADVATLAGLNRDQRVGPDPDKFDWIPE